MTGTLTRDAHPVDGQGRILPSPGWPADRAAPGDLELVRRFCNSCVRENGADRFATAAGFDQWLRRERRTATKPNAADLARIVAFREAVHAITTANSQHEPLAGAWAKLADLIADVTFSVRPGRDGLDLVANSRSATAAFLGELALICRRAQNDGTLRRLKSCVNCEWTIYDASKNQSGRWCSMNACGGRHNARTYRQRQRR
jgi:predicted RNA-binding Zn ribbon-like protein